MLPPFPPMAMAISSRQTPGSRVECFERKDNTRLLPKMPSVMERRHSSPNLISVLLFKVGLEAHDEFFVRVVAVTQKDSEGGGGF
jgi:hypothetical protein